MTSTLNKDKKTCKSMLIYLKRLVWSLLAFEYCILYKYKVGNFNWLFFIIILWLLLIVNAINDLLMTTNLEKRRWRRETVNMKWWWSKMREKTVRRETGRWWEWRVDEIYSENSHWNMRCSTYFLSHLV